MSFRFGIMGAAKIAVKFCDAVRRVDGCEVAAVASKSRERADAFAKNNDVPAAYDDYEEMLLETKPDCVYIAVTPHDHYRLAMLCLDHGIPVLCEKAMFLNAAQAREVFERSKKLGVFVMEAMWSRFLPAVLKAKEWFEEGRIGTPRLLESVIGFKAPPEPDNRYRNPALGGGPAFDITVYTFEVGRYFMRGEMEGETIAAIPGSTGVTATECVTQRYGDMLAVMTTSFEAALDDRLVIYGDNGKIAVNMPNFAETADLYDENGSLVESFSDTVTENGFVYEIREVVDCVRAGKVESAVVPHSLTLECAELFDRIMKKAFG